MARNSKYSDEELKEYINKFYDYFSDGYKFEEFLKIYLEKLGFTEVVVTKRSRDGGIDLTASRTTIGVFGNEHYFIQAKRNKPPTTVSPEKTVLYAVLSILMVKVFLLQQQKYLITQRKMLCILTLQNR